MAEYDFVTHVCCVKPGKAAVILVRLYPEIKTGTVSKSRFARRVKPLHRYLVVYISFITEKINKYCAKSPFLALPSCVRFYVYIWRFTGVSFYASKFDCL